jgi:NitT/TauT family transport system ATP-binding protein
MQRRAALARSLVYGGDIFILDEPFKGLDQKLRLDIYPHIRDLAVNSLVLLVSHDKEELTALADIIIKLDGPPLSIV